MNKRPLDGDQMKAYPIKTDENGHQWLHENNVAALMMLSFGVGAFLAGTIVYLIFFYFGR